MRIDKYRKYCFFSPSLVLFASETVEFVLLQHFWFLQSWSNSISFGIRCRRKWNKWIYDEFMAIFDIRWGRLGNAPMTVTYHASIHCLISELCMKRDWWDAICTCRHIIMYGIYRRFRSIWYLSFNFIFAQYRKPSLLLVSLNEKKNECGSRQNVSTTRIYRQKILNAAPTSSSHARCPPQFFAHRAHFKHEIGWSLCTQMMYFAFRWH